MKVCSASWGAHFVAERLGSLKCTLREVRMVFEEGLVFRAESAIRGFLKIFLASEAATWLFSGSALRVDGEFLVSSVNSSNMSYRSLPERPTGQINNTAADLRKLPEQKRVIFRCQFGAIWG